MGHRIIVIDDSDTVREQVSTVLTGAGYEIVEAGDGVDGAEVIRANAGASLAICDVNMPRLGGVEMLEKLAGAGNLTLPVLMLTTEGRPDLIERARAAGAKGWMVKPFKSTMLLAAVQKLVALRSR